LASHRWASAVVIWSWRACRAGQPSFRFIVSLPQEHYDRFCGRLDLPSKSSSSWS